MLSLKYLKIQIWLILVDASDQYVNLALNKPAWQQSNNVDNRWFAVAAVDGDKRQFAGSGSCALTKKTKSGTWRVDLQNETMIHYIDIYYRYESPSAWESQYQGRMAGFFIFVSNTTKKEDGYLCFHETQNQTHPPTPSMSIPCVQSGRYVIYYNERRDDTNYPSYYSDYLYNELCDVEVYACNYSYGTKCSALCGYCLNREKCNPITGACPSDCIAGWRDEKCDRECLPGTYGINCNDSCGINCHSNPNNPCNTTSGECTLGCKPGWQGKTCNRVCNNSYYGYQCANHCGRCRDRKICNHINGTCPFGCEPGWQGTKCDAECDNFWYGSQCAFQCGNCLEGQSCHHLNGACPHGCEQGWLGDECKIDENTFNSYCQRDSTDNALIVAVVGWVLTGLSNVIWILMFVIWKKRYIPMTFYNSKRFKHQIAFEF